MRWLDSSIIRFCIFFSKLVILCIKICFQATHELEPELILSKVLEQYGDFSSGFTKEYATKNRDMVLDALSDSGTVAPLIMTANLHSRANPKSYMYVFSHPKAMQDYSGVSRSRRYNEDRLSRLRRPSTKRDPTWSEKNVARSASMGEERMRSGERGRGKGRKGRFAGMMS